MGILDIMSGAGSRPARKKTGKAKHAELRSQLDAALAKTEKAARKKKKSSKSSGEATVSRRGKRQAASSLSPSVSSRTKRGRENASSPPSDPARAPEAGVKSEVASTPASTVRPRSGSKNLTLPKGYKGKKVIFAGMKPRTTGGRRLYEGQTFMVEGAVTFHDCLDKATVMFEIKSAKDGFQVKAFPYDIRIGKKDFRKVAAAMLKHAGIE